VIVAVFILTAYAANALIGEAQLLSSQVSYEQINSMIAAGEKVIKEYPELEVQLEKIMSYVASNLSAILENIGFSITGMILSAINLAITLAFSFIIAFYLLRDGKKLKETILELIPKSDTATIRDVIDSIDKNLESMFFGSLMSAVSVAVIVSVVLFLSGVSHYVLIGIFSGIAQFIPGLGPQIVLVLSAIVLAMFGNWVGAIICILLSIILVFGTGMIIGPFFMRHKTHPLVVIIAFISGILVFGPKGFVLGPIIFATLQGLIQGYGRL
jgi:predicted PurR-regulated permease PerM